MPMYNIEPYQEKLAAIRDMKLDQDTFLRLFFQARNNAIEAGTAVIKDFLTSQGLDVTVRWKEDCRLVSIHITLNHKGEHLRYAWIDRVRTQVGNKEAVSECVYKLQSIQNTEYYRYRKPKMAEEFDNVLGSESFFSLVDRQVNRANYPFGYNSFSSV